MSENGANPRRPAGRPDPQSGNGVHALLARFLTSRYSLSGFLQLVYTISIAKQNCRQA